MEEILMDAHDNDEKKFSSMVFDSYLKCKNREHYHLLLRQIEREFSKSIDFLRGLLEVYVRNYASKNDLRLFKNKRNELYLNKCKFMSYCDELFSLPSEKRINYVVSSNIAYSDLSSYLKRYKSNNGMYCEQVDDFITQYKDYCDKTRREQLDKIHYNNYKKGCAFFDELVNLGFYNIPYYMKYLNNKYNYYKEYSTANALKKYIRDYDVESWKDYELIMEENKKNSFFMVKDRIELFISRLKNNEGLDIIDYYMIVGVPVDNLIQLCSDFIPNCDIVCLKIFLNAYKSTNLMSYCQFMDDDPYFDEKNTVVQFLYNNNIPFEYFNCALAKYYAGGLDQYIGKSKKLTNL